MFTATTQRQRRRYESERNHQYVQIDTVLGSYIDVMSSLNNLVSQLEMQTDYCNNYWEIARDASHLKAAQVNSEKDTDAM